MKLQLFVICMISVFWVGYAAEEFCYSSVKTACGTTSYSSEKSIECNSKYGAFKGDGLMTSVQNFAKSHILKSFHYLLMSSHFGNYETNRGGFEKLYRELSDDTWEKGIDLMKFITKRGGRMQFDLPKAEASTENKKFDDTFEFEKYELGSMAKALELQKHLAEDANLIHSSITGGDNHDSEAASYFENNFVHQHSSSIRKLSGYTNDLKKLVSQQDASLSLYLFDEYLKNSV